MSSIQLTQFGSVKSFTSRRMAHCKNCSVFDGQDMVRKVLQPGEKRISLTCGAGKQTRTLYLCIECAEFQAERLESLALDIRRAVLGWVDTEAEFYARAVL